MAVTHTVGSCYTNGTSVYVHVPKCASTAIKDALLWKWSPVPVEGPGFAVVRDPVSRFFSGVWQYAERHDLEYGRLLDQIEASWSPVLDEHTRPQTVFLEPFDVELVRIESASVYVLDRFGVDIGVKNEGGWEVRGSLVRFVERFYAADAALYEKAE